MFCRLVRKRCDEEGEHENSKNRELFFMKRKHLFRWQNLIDYWSMPHFLFGTVMALLAVTFSLAFEFMLALTLSLAVIWEILEIRTGLREAFSNRMSDIVLALCSFILTFLITNHIHRSIMHPDSLLIITILFFFGINFFAWRARFEHDKEFEN